MKSHSWMTHSPLSKALIRFYQSDCWRSCFRTLDRRKVCTSQVDGSLKLAAGAGHEINKPSEKEEEENLIVSETIFVI